MFTLLKLIFVCFTPLVNHLTIYNQSQQQSVQYAEEKIRKNWADGSDIQGGIAGGGLEEFVSYNFFTVFRSIIKDNDNIFNSGVSYNSFLNGYPIEVDTTGLPIAAGELTRDGTGPYGMDMDSNHYIPIVKIRFSYNMNDTYAYGFNVRFYANSDTYYYASCIYEYMDIDFNHQSTIFSTTGFYGSASVLPTTPTYCCILYGVNYFKGLLPATLYLDNNLAVYNNGYDNGFEEGYASGVERGKEIASDPASDIYETTYNIGYQAGRTDGINVASANSGIPALIFSGILNVALLPVDVFLQMFQYEVFGINIAGLISGLLTVAMVITVLRFVIGGKSKDD